MERAERILSLASRRAVLKGLSAGAVALSIPRAKGLILPGGGASGSSVIPWTPAYYQNFDSYSPGTSGILNTYGISAVSATEFYSNPNSARIDIANGSTQPGGAAEALTANINPTIGDQVWFRVRTFFPSGFNFTAGGGPGANALKFLRMETDPSGSHAPAHIDCYLVGGSATAVGGFDWIYEGSSEGWMFGGTAAVPSGIVRGQWQTWEFYQYLSDVDGTAIWRMWRDGTLILDTKANIPSGVPQRININSGYVIPYVGGPSGPAGFMHCTYWNGGSHATQSWYIDDFTIATDIYQQVPPYFDSAGNRFIGLQNP